jgi:hypothetical protein
MVLKKGVKMKSKKLCIIDMDEILEEVRNNTISEDTVILTSVGYIKVVDEDNDALFYIEDLYKASSFIMENFPKYLLDIINTEEIYLLFRRYIEMIKNNIYPEQENISEEIINLIRQKFDKK